MPEQRVWEPTKRQEEFISIPDSVPEALYGGAAGGGKSEILMMLPIVRGFHNYPRFKGLLMRRTYPELEKSLILRSQEWYPLAGATYNKQVRRWVFPSGAVMDFGYAEHEQDVRKYDTTEYNYIGWDELTSFTEFQYLYIGKSRCRTSDTNLPAFNRGATNPGNIGHGWCRKRFVEPAPPGTLIRDTKTGQMRIFIQSLLTDNPHLMAADPNYIRNLELLPEAEKKAKLYGDWWTFSGQVFDDFRVAPLSDEPENARHVIPAFDIPSYWPKVIFCDWGYSAMNYVGKLAASPMGRAYLYYEYATKQTKISEWGANVVRDSNGETFVDKVLDPSAWANTGAEKTVAQQIIEATGLMFRAADNDRLGGKTLLQEYLRWRPRPAKKVPAEGFNPEMAQWLLRWKGQSAYEDYIDAFKPEAPEENIPKLQIFEQCKEVIRAIPLCVYGNGQNGDPEDVAEFTGDDPYDALRYGVKAVDRFYRTAKKAAESVEEREKILNDFARTGDQTAFHRRMDALESKQSRRRTPLRRFHRVGSH